MHPLVRKKELSVLAIDLNDIFESCYNYICVFYPSWPPRLKTCCKETLILQKLMDMEIELDHIHWHYKSLKKELKKIYNS